ncbi:hypothetical protein AABH71_005086 [Salmonella enterica]|uniref:hypothetical protein n=1 Tax=Salmonella enterica TaxID=28901 RepID=UPI001D7605B5|nr:hypothetical protein [Salmonella enterica]
MEEIHEKTGATSGPKGLLLIILALSGALHYINYQEFRSFLEQWVVVNKKMHNHCTGYP